MIIAANLGPEKLASAPAASHSKRSESFDAVIVDRGSRSRAHQDGSACLALCRMLATTIIATLIRTGTGTEEPERTYEHQKAAHERLRCERRYSLVGTIATSNRKSAGKLGRTIAQPIPLRTGRGDPMIRGLLAFAPANLVAHLGSLGFASADNARREPHHSRHWPGNS